MRTTSTLPALVLAAALLVLGTGCGGGGGSTTQSLMLPTVPERTAWNEIDVLVESPAIPYVGDTDADFGIQGFVSFALEALPPDAGISQATLVLPIQFRYGDPASFGDLFVDVVDIDADGFEYLPQLLEAPDATATPDLVAAEIRVDVTSLVRQANADGGSYVDFRLRFALETDFDGTADLLLLADPDAAPGTGNRLEIDYR